MMELEERGGDTLLETDPIFPWVLEHGCDVFNTCKVRQLDKTVWESFKGKPYSDPVVGRGAPGLLELVGFLTDAGLIEYSLVRRGEIGAFCVSKKDDRLRLFC